jgi:hypothetical protein
MALKDGETVHDLDLGWIENDAGVLALTGSRVLFVPASQPLGNPRQHSRTEVTGVSATWGDDWTGELTLAIRGRALTISGLHNTDRFRDDLVETLSHVLAPPAPKRPQHRPAVRSATHGHQLSPRIG